MITGPSRRGFRSSASCSAKLSITVAARLQIVSELLCEAVDLRRGQAVLDVATGTGNTAIAAARRWCEVTAIDYVPRLLELGRARAAAEGLPVRFLKGDA